MLGSLNSSTECIFFIIKTFAKVFLKTMKTLNKRHHNLSCRAAVKKTVFSEIRGWKQCPFLFIRFWTERIVKSRRWRVRTGPNKRNQRRWSVSWRRKVRGHKIAGLTGWMFIPVSLNTLSKKPKRWYKSTRDSTSVEWRSPAVLLRLKFNPIMCYFFVTLNFLLPFLWSLSSFVLFGKDHLIPASCLIEAISLLTLIYWQRINKHECLSVFVHVCVHLCIYPKAGSDCSFARTHTRVCVFSSTVQSVVRESQVICESKEKQIAELKKMLDQSTDSLKNEWEKKVWRKTRKGFGNRSPAPCKQPWARGRTYYIMRLAPSITIFTIPHKNRLS